MFNSTSVDPVGISTASCFFFFFLIKLSVHLQIELNWITFLTGTPLNKCTNLTTELDMTGRPLFLWILNEKLDFISSSLS